MNSFAVIVLLGWLPIVVLIFSMVPPPKAVAITTVFAWLYLPMGGFALPGLPDYTKTSGTVVGVLLSAAMFDSGRLLALRPRWFDLPVIVWTVSSFATTLINGLTPYDAVSFTIEHLFYWGLPYLIGRAYLTDAESIRGFAVAIAIGGLSYIPLCLLEMRLSPFLSMRVYGVGVWEGMRYGGYRPRVFFANGLALSLWMMCSALVCYVLWRSGALRKLWGLPFGLMMLALVVTSVLCRSTGSTALMFVGMAAFWATVKTRKKAILWFLVLISPAYCVARTFELWSGRQVVDLANATVGGERAQSFEFRLDMERRLADRALERPIFGWAGYNRFQVIDKTGRTVTTPDGYWIIVLGTYGAIGLVCCLMLFLMPMVMVLRHYPIETWTDPRVGPVVALSMMMLMSMIDCLSNAMLMPLFGVITGGVMGMTPVRAGGSHARAEEALAAASECVEQGRPVEALEEFRLAIELTQGAEDDDGRTIQAEGYDGLGHTLLASGRPDEAAEAFREALGLRDELAAESRDDDRFRDLAVARDGLSRALAESGRTVEAIEERRHALEIWDILAANQPRDAETRDHRANTLNDLAWLLAADAPDRDPALAVTLAEEATRIAPDLDASWNTLGVARYRAGDWPGAIEALERSANSSPGGLGTAFDHYILAMAWHHLHRDDQAEEWLERGIAWTARHRPGHPTLERFRAEAEALVRVVGSG